MKLLYPSDTHKNTSFDVNVNALHKFFRATGSGNCSKILVDQAPNVIKSCPPNSLSWPQPATATPPFQR